MTDTPREKIVLSASAMNSYLLFSWIQSKLMGNIRLTHNSIYQSELNTRLSARPLKRRRLVQIHPRVPFLEMQMQIIKMPNKKTGEMHDVTLMTSAEVSELIMEETARLVAEMQNLAVDSGILSDNKFSGSDVLDFKTRESYHLREICVIQPSSMHFYFTTDQSPDFLRPEAVRERLTEK